MNKEDVKLVESVLNKKYKTYFDGIRLIFKIRVYEENGEIKTEKERRAITDLINLLADHDIYIRYYIERIKCPGFVNVTSVCIGSVEHIINGGLPKQD